MTEHAEPNESRRTFLVKSGLLLAAASLGGAACGREMAPGEVSPNEDLMREHGVLRRLMLVYDEMARRLKTEAAVPSQVLAKANDIIHRFIQEYHERNEETQVFNRFSSAGKMVELVAILYQQHLAGRKIIAAINALNTDSQPAKPVRAPQDRGVADCLQPALPAPRRLGGYRAVPGLSLGNLPEGLCRGGGDLRQGRGETVWG